MTYPGHCGGGCYRGDVTVRRDSRLDCCLESEGETEDDDETDGTNTHTHTPVDTYKDTS